MLVDGERGEDPASLGDDRDTAPRHLVRSEPVDPLAVERDRAFARTDQRGKRIAKRRLAHAVPADDGERRLAGLERDALQDVGVAVADMEVADRQHQCNPPR